MMSTGCLGICHLSVSAILLLLQGIPDAHLPVQRKQSKEEAIIWEEEEARPPQKGATGRDTYRARMLDLQRNRPLCMLFAI